MTKEEAIKRIKDWNLDDDDMEVLSAAIPELKENEDEKMINFISNELMCLRALESNGGGKGSDRYEELTKGIAWLEKQGSESNWCHHKVDLSNCSEEYRKAYCDGRNNCNMQHSQCKSEGNDVVKCLINGMKFYYEGNEEATWGTEKLSMKVKDILSWLEKQGTSYTKKDVDDAYLKGISDTKNELEKQDEQKPADTPKFKVGDWIVNNNGEPRVFRVEKQDWPDSVISGSLGSQFINTDTLNKQYHLWTIQDAKEGDVLFFNDGHGNDCIELIKSITDKKIEFWFCLTNGNHYEVFDGITPYTNFASREDAHPATQEQRDFLFTKMKEAGYEWDAEKKELKKIEQKTTWGEEDEKHIMAIDLAVNRCMGKWDCCGEICPISEHNDWLKSIKGRVQSQPRWNEEDEMMLECVLDKIGDLGTGEMCKDWLKALKKQMKGE